MQFVAHDVEVDAAQQFQNCLCAHACLEDFAAGIAQVAEAALGEQAAHCQTFHVVYLLLNLVREVFSFFIEGLVELAKFFLKFGYPLFGQAVLIGGVELRLYRLRVLDILQLPAFQFGVETVLQAINFVGDHFVVNFGDEILREVQHAV